MRHDGRVSKADLRARVRAARRARTEDGRREAADALARHGLTLLPPAPATVATYLSLPAEPGTDRLNAALLAAGYAVRAPRIRGDYLEWVELTTDSELHDGPMGIREPVGPALPASALADVSVVFLPALAADRRGLRLGQGGGYYDRALAQVPTHGDGGPLRVVVLFDDEVLDDVPTEPHDCRVDVALTPATVVRLS